MGSKEKAGSQAGDMASLERKAEELGAEIVAMRAKIVDIESAQRRKIAQKIELEDGLSALLRRNLSSEKAILSRVKSVARLKEVHLREQIASLERVNKIFEEKKERVEAAKKRYVVLKKQLVALEKQAEGLGNYE
ncbi:MAG: hypothetical protein Q8N60_00295 [Candidatus Diapherotrites archaeon]|nr:hypothetical protein [Candidatus Diapherotrites archaeon]